MDSLVFKLVGNFLDEVDLLQCAVVSKEWRIFSDSDDLWKRLVLERSYLNKRLV